MSSLARLIQNPWGMGALLCLGLLIVDQSLNAFFQLVLLYVLINMILAMGLNLINGTTGQFSLGHAGFMAVGAYVSGFLSLQVDWPAHSIFLQWVLLLSFAVAAAVAAGLAGYAVGLPSLRLRGDYLAIVTLGFGEIIRTILLNTEAVGGARGMSGIPGPQAVEFGGITISGFLIAGSHAVFWLVLIFTLLWRLQRSRSGRAWLAVREDEIAAESMGVATTQAKVRAFVLSSACAGVGGAIFAHATNYLSPATFSFMKSVDVVIMVVLGGMGSLTGSLFGAVFVTLLPELLRPLQDWTGVDLRMILYSLFLIGLMLLRPTGLMGKLEISDVWRSWRGRSPS